MTDPHPESDPARLAAAARSILACPAEVSLVVDGVDHLLEGMAEVGMQDLAGRPTFYCPPDARLATAARTRRSALLSLDSGLGPPGSPDRTTVLTLAGRLETLGREDCDCCGEPRDVITLDLNFVLLSLTGDTRTDQQYLVPLPLFASADHQLNRGFLQRSAEHANLCHQEQLRRAVASSTGTRFGAIAGVSLTGVHPHGAEIRWVDDQGAHSQVLTFPRTASTTEELGELLRDQLHAGLC